MNRLSILALGILAVIATVWLWHGPIGAGERLARFLRDDRAGRARQMEADARAQLDRDEMIQVRAKVERGPLSRRLILSGPADDFQRREIKRRLETLPGVGEALWSADSLQTEQRQ